MRIRTPHSDSIVPEATRYDTTLATLPLLLVVGAAVGALSSLPVSPVVGASDLIPAAVLAYGLFAATPGSAAGPINGPGASAGTDAPLNGVATHTRDDASRNRRRGNA